ncbi:hypothetical protein RRG08_004226 [Elysia crispata]|uniref:Uncharacterized protein n=1 Tax=Elysia crispata TaxID=231223 RepID=A0AAE0ZJU3_9GAST|nr:hypothetical protein RRG08_004226 [Elysia crispata]
MKNKELSQQTQITEAGYHRAEGKQNDRQNGGDNVGIRVSFGHKITLFTAKIFVVAGYNFRSSRLVPVVMLYV